MIPCALQTPQAQEYLGSKQLLQEAEKNGWLQEGRDFFMFSKTLKMYDRTSLDRLWDRLKKEGRPTTPKIS